MKTTQKREVLDLTSLVGEQINGNDEGIVSVFVPHTTAAITTADLDPGTDQDLLDALDGMTPKGRWRHPHDPEHFPDHLWASVVGPSVSIPFSDGRLQLGTWQRIILVELNGPRTVEITVTLLRQMP